MSVIATTSLDPLILTASPLVGDRKALARGGVGSLAGAHRIQGLLPCVSRRPKAAIAAELAQAHSGTFTAARQPGHGTRLTLTLTVPRASTSPPWRRHIACTAGGFA